MTKIKKIHHILLFLWLMIVLVGVNTLTATAQTNAPVPITADWVKQHLRKAGPKIVLTAQQLKAIKKAIKTDTAMQAYYTFLYKNALATLALPPLEKKLTGRRLLPVSRAAVSRMSTLAIVFAISGEKRFLNKLNDDIVTVCNFSDWNPSHFLDVGEMAYAVSVGLDWSLGKLKPATIALAKKALVEKALVTSLDKKWSGWWVNSTNNWNQVCHGGLSIAAIAIADQNPGLAAQILDRAVKNMPIALKEYGPDGVYPEGPSYWAYGTTYTLLTIAALESAFGTDFNLSQTPGLIQSGLFVKMVTAPSGLYYNYFDSNTEYEWAIETPELFTWFATKTKNKNFFEEAAFISTVKKATTNGINVSRVSGAALCWMLNTKNLQSKPLPNNWKGDGANPMIVFKSYKADSSGFYLAAKGGKASLNHGNMDAGSFIFELNKVRWSVDLGMQDYVKLEEIIGNDGLWDTRQDSKRWLLLSKNNFGHSTLTVNNQLHKSDGYAPLISFINSESQPQASFDLSALYPQTLAAAIRKFKKISENRLEVEDSLSLTASTQNISWAMMTRADAKIIDKGFELTQNGKKLRVILKTPLQASLKIEALNPPPLPYDMFVPNLKRIIFNIKPETLIQHGSKITVHVFGPSENHID